MFRITIALIHVSLVPVEQLTSASKYSSMVEQWGLYPEVAGSNPVKIHLSLDFRFGCLSFLECFLFKMIFTRNGLILAISKNMNKNISKKNNSNMNIVWTLINLLMTQLKISFFVTREKVAKLDPSLL